MGKNFETKKEILESLAVHKRTLTDLSRQLGLSPSTVKQHLEELRALNLVRYVDEMYLHKFKYYEASPGTGFGYNRASQALLVRRRAMVRPMTVA